MNQSLKNKQSNRCRNSKNYRAFMQKNTAVCAIIVVLSAKAQGFDIAVLLPSNHHIADDINYLNTINTALHYVNEFGICTISIPINVISAEYGFINTGLSIAANVYRVHFEF